MKGVKDLIKKKIYSFILSFTMILSVFAVGVSAENTVISNLIVVGGNAEVTVSWNNGDMSSVARIEVYEGTTRLASSAANAKAGVTVVGTDNNRLSKESNKGIIVNISGLANDSEHTYKVVTTSSADGTRTEYVTNTAATSASDKITDGWKKSYSGYAKSYAETTYDEAIVGGVSLKIVSAADSDNVQKIIPELVSELTEGNMYKLEFYAKSDDDGKITVSAEQVVEKTLTSEWKKYTQIFEYIGEAPGFAINSRTSGVYIDWVTLYETDSDGNNLSDNFVLNGNFESTASGEASVVPEAFNFMVAGRDRSVVVSWRNPKANNIKKITVFNENGEAIADSTGSDISTVSEASNSIQVNDLSNGKKYKYSLRIDYSGGLSYCTEAVSNTLGDEGQMLWGAPKGVQAPTGWLESVAGNTYTKFEVTSKEKYDGNASLLVRNNLDSEKSNTFQRFGADVPEESGKTYRLNFYAKAVNVSMFVILYNKDGKEERISVNLGTNDWKQYSFDVPSHPKFQFERRADALYLDNCELYEIDADGNKIGDNLITNGGFEEGFNEAAPAEVENVSGELGMDNAYIAWKSEPTDASYIHVYTKNGDSEYLRAIVNPGVRAVMLDGGIANEFIIRTVNSSGIESEGVTVSCTPADVEISEPVLSLDGQEIENLVPGKVNVSMKIKNNGMGDEYSAVLIVGLYEGNVMKQYKTQYKLLPELGISAAPVEFSIDADVDEVTENTTLKVFVWDSMENRNSISDMTIFK